MLRYLNSTAWLFIAFWLASCAPKPGGLSSLPSVETGIDYTLTPENGYVKYTSPSVMDQSYFGHSMAVGDFNGDGYNDLASGVPFADIENNTNTGGVVVYNGTSTTAASNGATYDYYDAFISAPNTNNNEFGRALAAYDLNGDGFDDLIVGAPGEEPSNRGAVYVFNGSASGLSTSPSQILGEPNSTANSGFGSALAVGDLNSDGFAELVVGAYGDDTLAADAGAIWIFKGFAAGIYSSAVATQVTGGNAAGDNFGNAVAIVRYNGDAFPDIVVGAPLDDNGGTADTGYFYVFNGTGSATTWVASLTVPSTSVVNPSGVASDYFAFSLQAGDINADGNADLIVGVPYADQYGGNQGLALVYDNIASNSVADAMIPATISAYGTTLSGYGMGLGDLNNDGYPDVLMGTPLHSEGAYGSGRVDAFFSNSAGVVHFSGVDAIYYPTSNLDGTYNSYDDYFGWAVCSGDVNGDGEDDMIVGAPYDDSKWADDGMVYIYHSRRGQYLNKPDVIIDAGGYRPTNRLYGSACVVMDYNRDNINDLLIGAMGDDFGGTDGGAVFVHLGTGIGVTQTPTQAIIDPGDNSNYFGKSLAAGDLNNDGFLDLVVGAYADDTGGADRGIVYVYPSDTTTGVISATPSTFQTVLANSDYFGYGVGVVDIDGDGDDDLLVGAIGDDTRAADSGRVVVYNNPGTADTLLNNVADAYIYHPTDAANSYFGSAIAFGFYSLTTYKDLIIGAYADDTVFTDGGAVYLYAGSASGPSATSTQSLNGLDGVDSASENLGSGIAIFDFDQDGVNDLAIGAFADDDSGQNGGSVYLRIDQ